ncbi:MAG: hypothetical protein PHE55_00065 [Methylococcaceae bacterium]|nr:hypothetical protein [Methylococcaceae bacterium]
MATFKKPSYINPTGISGPRDLPSSPPFAFRNVTARVFPIKANMARLTDFCASYVNMDIPDDIAQFFPALPYVYLAVVNYGSMSPISVQAQNIGWVAQHEVFFLIPLEKWRKEGGRLVFKEWACVSPFIYVDDAMSMTTGREVYGWAKVAGEIDQETPLWVENPTAPTRLFSLRVPVFPKEYEGKREENRLLLQIDRDPPPNLSMFPPDLKSPFVNLSTATYAWFGLMGDAADMLTALPARGYRSSRDLRSLLSMAGKAGGSLLRMFPSLLRRQLLRNAQQDDLGFGRAAEAFINQITLKQFRDAGDPSQACYQALVSSRMGLDRFNRCGMLGDYNVMRGDPSGGFTLRLHQYEAYPIVESLGLEVDRFEENPDAPVAIIKPTFPIWSDVDLYYDIGQIICERHACSYGNGFCAEWHAESEHAPQASKENPPSGGSSHPAKGAGKPHRHDTAADPDPSRRVLYNTVRGGSSQAIAGPFDFPDITLQVYPLLADRGKLKEFLDNYLNSPLNPHAQETGLSFEPFGDYVYLMVDVYGDQAGVMWSESNNIGWWADKSVSFSVPVKCYRDGKLQSVALVSPYQFANNGRAVISDREVNGRPTAKASIETHPDAWLDESGPIAARRMLKLSCEVFPALNVGQRSIQSTLLEIDQRLPLPENDETGWRLIAERWREPLVRDLTRKTLFRRVHKTDVDHVKALGLEILTQDAPVNGLHIKQYRDASDTSKACYQALVRTRRSIERIYDIREIEPRVYVRIHQIPDHPIVETLGLKVMHVDSSGSSVEQVLQPIRPFWMRFGGKENLGEVLCWRVENGPWTLTASMLEHQAYARTRVGAGILEQLGHLKQRLREKANQWLFEALSREVKDIQRIILNLAEGKRQELIEELDACPDGEDKSTARYLAADALKLLINHYGDAELERRIRQLFRSISTEDLYEVVEAISKVAGNHGEITSIRLSWEQARISLENVDDVQVIIDSILSEKWGNWDDSRQEEEPQPEFRLPADAFAREGFGVSRTIGENQYIIVESDNRQRVLLEKLGHWYFVPETALVKDLPLQLSKNIQAVILGEIKKKLMSRDTILDAITHEADIIKAIHEYCKDKVEGLSEADREALISQLKEDLAEELKGEMLKEMVS